MNRVVYITFLSLIIFFTGCTLNDKETKKNKYQTKKVLCIVKTLDNPYFIEMVKGFRKAEKESKLGYSLIIRAGNAEGDVNGQRNILDNFFLEDVAGKTDPNILAVILTPASSGGALVPEIKKYRDNFIPVLIVDTPILEEALATDSTDITTFIASDNRSGGKKAANELIPFINTKSRILLLNGLDGHETAILRKEGFLEGLDSAKISNVELTQRSCDWEKNKARETVQAFLSTGKIFDIIFAANDQMAIGAVEAYKQNKIDMKKVHIIGFDAIPEAKLLVEEGILYATMQQHPQEMGAIAIKIVDKILTGSSFKDNISIPVDAYKKINK